MLFVIFALLYNQQRYANALIPNEDGLVLGHKKLLFDEDGITEMSSFGTGFYKWRAVEAFEENEGEYYIFVDRAIAIIVPENAFTDTVQQKAFCELIAKYSGV